jgi:hypothetical protein
VTGEHAETRTASSGSWAVVEIVDSESLNRLGQPSAFCGRE